MPKDIEITTASFTEAIARIAKVPSQKYETKTHVIHRNPRISAAKLAQFMVADDSCRFTIVKNCKRAPKKIMGQYAKVRASLYKAFDAEHGLKGDFFTQLATEIEHEIDEPMQMETNRLCAAAIKHLATIAGGIDCANGSLYPRPQEGWGALMMSGVKVSINPDLVFSAPHRGVMKMGGVILNTSKQDNMSLDKKSSDFSAGQYLTTLLHAILEQNFKDKAPTLNARCYAVDVFRDTIYTAPARFKTLLNRMEAACRSIASLWGTIPVESEAREDEQVEEMDDYPF